MRKIAMTLMILSAASVDAIDMIPANSNYYFKMGGGSDLSMPPVSDQTNIDIGGDVNTSLGFTCDGFNPAISIGNTINNIKSSVEGLSGNIINSATSAVGSLPMYLLSKSNKDLYNLIQNTMSSASDVFHLSMKSCQDSLGDIKNGKSPYQDWFSVSDSQGWVNASKQAAQGQNVDANDVKDQITKDPQKYGVPWTHKGQNSGGTNGNQVPIKVIYDVIIAGYNATVDPTLSLDSKNTKADNGSGLARYWPEADDAGQWAKLVLGDITISSIDGNDTTAHGVGLMTLVQTCPDNSSSAYTCAKTIQQNLADIVKTEGPLTGEQLESISSSQMMATPALIEGIRNKDTEDQAIAISKWSQDVAIQNVVDEALLLRTILITGSQTKPVHNLKPAMTMVQTSIDQLNTDINDITYEFSVKKALMGNTAASILEDQDHAEASATREDTQTQTPVMRNGAVYTDNNG
jgi:integrating conjugative element protein (TIGR03755 family)